MTSTEWKPEFTSRAKEFWKRYAASHDLSDMEGKIAAVDPVNGQVWIGNTARQIADAMRASGTQRPVCLIRVGADYFVRKGRR